jgi:hypothetical protein
VKHTLRLGLATQIISTLYPFYEAPLSPPLFRGARARFCSNCCFIGLFLLLCVAVQARADYMVYEYQVSNIVDPSCKSSLFIDAMGGRVCLVFKHPKDIPAELDGNPLKLGGELKPKHGTYIFVVEKVNPKEPVGTFKATGFNGFLVGAGPYIGGAAAAVSGSPMPNSASGQSGAASSVSGGTCTEVTQYVKSETQFFQQGSAGHCVGGVDPHLTNQSGQTVTCKLFFHKNGQFEYKGGFGGMTFTFEPGQGYSNYVDAECGSDTGQIEYACYPKAQEEAFSCLEHRIDWK